MIFTEQFIEDFKADEMQGIVVLCQLVKEGWAKASRSTSDWNSAEHEITLEAYALLIELSEAKLLRFNRPGFSLSGSPMEDGGRMAAYINALNAEADKSLRERTVIQMRQRFKATIGSAFAYEFSKGDLERVQILINELRELISSTAGFEQSHQRRLLLRLERLQAEMHKKVSDLDHLWGLVGDAGVVFAKLGNDAKPIVDRIRELAGITWSTQARAEELPSGTALPQLGNDTGEGKPAPRL